MFRWRFRGNGGAGAGQSPTIEVEVEKDVEELLGLFSADRQGTSFVLCYVLVFMVVLGFGLHVYMAFFEGRRGEARGGSSRSLPPAGKV